MVCKCLFPIANKSRLQWLSASPLHVRLTLKLIQASQPSRLTSPGFYVIVIRFQFGTAVPTCSLCGPLVYNYNHVLSYAVKKLTAFSPLFFWISSLTTYINIIFTFLCIGIIVGAIMKYGIDLTSKNHQVANCTINSTAAPTNLWITVNGTKYSYYLSGPVSEASRVDVDNLEEKVQNVI